MSSVLQLCSGAEVVRKLKRTGWTVFRQKIPPLNSRGGLGDENTRDGYFWPCSTMKTVV